MSRSLPLAALLAALSAAACHREPKAELPTQAGPAVIGVRAVRPGSADQALPKVTGEIRARREATLAPEVSGRIAALRVEVGDQVKKGQVLVELESAAMRIQVDQARAGRAVAAANLQSVRNELERTTALAKGGAAPPAALERVTLGAEQASAGLHQAEAALAGAEDRLARALVRAPFDGVVTARLKSVGELIPATMPAPVLTLVDLGSIELKAAVPETVVDLLAPGAELACRVSPSGKPFRAKVRVIGSVVEPGSRTIDVRADPLDPKMPELRPGSLVEVDLAAAGAAQGLFVRADVVQRQGENAFVWVVQGEKVQRRAVQVEKAGPGSVRVLSGLTSEDRVVADGDARLVEGAAVRVTE